MRCAWTQWGPRSRLRTCRAAKHVPQKGVPPGTLDVTIPGCHSATTTLSPERYSLQEHETAVSAGMEAQQRPPSASLATGRSPQEIATSAVVDPRIPALLPGFDAPFFQAGLAGYSDAAMRLVARAHGCPYAITEALLDRVILEGGRGRGRENPDLLQKIATEEGCGSGVVATNAAGSLHDHPIAGQIMGTHPDEMARSATMLAEMGFDVIDVNFACPVKKVSRANRGGHFLTAPDEAIEVLKAVRAAVPATIPTTVKLRRSWDDTPEMEHNFDIIFDALYNEGYIWATVHGRTVEQKYNGPSRWQFLTDLCRRHPDRLIFGSGDIWEAADIFRMLDETGVHAVSVARGCIGNPWIFQQARQMMAGQATTEPTLDEQREVLLEHYRFSVALHGEHRASKMMRKFGIQFSKHHPTPDAAKAAFIRCRTLDEWHESIRERYGTSPDVPTDSSSS